MSSDQQYTAEELQTQVDILVARLSDREKELSRLRSENLRATQQSYDIARERDKRERHYLRTIRDLHKIIEMICNGVDHGR